MADAFNDIEYLCRISHDAYEAAAAGSGWETNPASRVAWGDVPEANKVAMRAAVAAVAAEVGEQIAKDIEEFREHLRKFPEPEDMPGGALHSFAWHRWRAAAEAMTRCAGIARQEGEDWERCRAARTTPRRGRRS